MTDVIERLSRVLPDRYHVKQSWALAGWRRCTWPPISSTIGRWPRLADALLPFPVYDDPGLSPAEAYGEAERFGRGALERDSTLGEASTALAH